MNFGRSSERQKYHIASLPMHEAKGEPEEEKYFPDIEHKVFCPGVFYPAPKKLFYANFLLLSRNVARDNGIKPIMTATIENLLFSNAHFYISFDQVANPATSRNSDRSTLTRSAFPKLDPFPWNNERNPIPVLGSRSKEDVKFDLMEQGPSLPKHFSINVLPAVENICWSCNGRRDEKPNIIQPSDIVRTLLLHRSESSSAHPSRIFFGNFSPLPNAQEHF